MIVFEQVIKGSNGVWCKINKEKSIFIPCKDVDARGDKCINYLKDISKTSDNYLRFYNNTKNAATLIEVCVRMWKISNMKLSEWFEVYIKPSDYT